MEEIYILLTERIYQTEEIKTLNKLLTFPILNDNVDSKAFSSSKSREFLDINKQLNLLKKREKKRVIKEDELIELVFNLKAFDLYQRQYKPYFEFAKIFNIGDFRIKVMKS